VKLMRRLCIQLKKFNGRRNINVDVCKGRKALISYGINFREIVLIFRLEILKIIGG
jgi:hypothetical protein